MKRFLAVLVVGCLVVGGCGVMMNSAQSERLDITATWAATAVATAETEEAVLAAIKDNATNWKTFKDAKGPWCGFSDVWMNAEYSMRLDECVAWANDMERRAVAGDMVLDQMRRVLETHSTLWQLFREARDGIAPTEEDD
ncbi:hypothetical protein ES708_18122 [subsurface metagenome]